MGNKLTSSKEVYRSLLSSATSGVPSKVNIDRETSKRQVLSLTSSLSNFIGKERRHFLICDVEKPGNNFEITARRAAMKGFTNFASKIDYIFDIKNGKYQLNYKKIKNILTNSNNSLIICGFTFLVYSFFIKVLKINKKKFKFPRGSFLLHIGGWKKLEEEKVTRNTFMEASVNLG